MIELILGISFVVNVILVWYIIQLLKRYLSFQEELDYFMEKLKEYESHVDTVNGLERFYGDETLGELVRHSKDIVKEYKDLKSIVENNYDEDDEEEMYAEEA